MRKTKPCGLLYPDNLRVLPVYKLVLRRQTRGYWTLHKNTGPNNLTHSVTTAARSTFFVRLLTNPRTRRTSATYQKQSAVITAAQRVRSMFCISHFSRRGSSMIGKRRSVDAIASRAAIASPVVSSIARHFDMLRPGRSCTVTST